MIPESPNSITASTSFANSRSLCGGSSADLSKLSMLFAILRHRNLRTAPRGARRMRVDAGYESPLNLDAMPCGDGGNKIHGLCRRS